MSTSGSFYRASRLEMMQQGVPEDYVDALLDDSYMERLILATNQANAKRDRKMKRYHRLQLVIFIYLLVQAFLGVFIALLKTVLVPEKKFSVTGELEGLDLLVMLDASERMRSSRDDQHNTAKEFADQLKKKMAEIKADKKIEKEKWVQEERQKGVNPLARFFEDMLKWASKKDFIQIEGGTLHVSTGLFNAKEENGARILHDFTGDLKIQEKKLEEDMKPEVYQSHAHWLSALELCSNRLSEGGRPKKRFCAIIGDNSAMCNKVESNPVSEICQRMPLYCPKPDDKRGHSLLEYSSEIKTCTDYVQKTLTGHNTQNGETTSQRDLIMMFHVHSKEEEQMRLKNPSFQDFVRETTDCKIKKTSGVDPTFEAVSQDDGKPDAKPCTRFIMATSYDEIINKANNIAEQLKPYLKDGEQIQETSWHFLWFLLLALGLPFFVIWSKLVRCMDNMTTQAKRAMGQKKKMIKVTKTLVEKPRRESVVERFAANLTEVELAEVAALQPPMEFGTPMTMRARLKGGYMRANPDTGAADGNGHVFDPNSNWVFEPVEPNHAETGCVQLGRRVRIRNAMGQLLQVDEDGTRFLPASENDEDSVALQPGLEFTIEEPEGGTDATCHLGETVRIKACATGKFLRVQKDGSCNGLGDPAEPETQFVVDRGGQPVCSGGLVTLTSLVNKCHLHGTPKGALQALPGGDSWRFWRISKKDSAAGSSTASNIATGQSMASAADNTASPVLKQGDIVTLQAVNQQMLTVDGQGRGHCGHGALGKVPEDSTADSSSTNAAAWTQEFVIDQVGMGLVSKYDTTLRNGVHVSLRPVQPETANSDQADGDVGFLRVNQDGSVTADGKVTNPAIAFILNASRLNDMVAPLQRTLQDGDCDLLIRPLWNKHEVKHLNAMSSSWTNDEDLAQLKGPVVVASDKGTYLVPKAKDAGWVAVVNEGVDIAKAAKQAKLQGATGLIVRCEEVLSLHKVARPAGQEQPELPTVYVDKELGEALNERGIELSGCESRKKHVTAVMRAIGNASQRTESEAIADVFAAAGVAMLEQHKEDEAKAETQQQLEAMQNQQAEEDTSDYKWKVQSNTHYLWGRSGGGATRLSVDYGKKLPPTAMKKSLKSTPDASAFRPREPSDSDLKLRKSVTVIEADDVKRHRLARELSDFLTPAQAEEHQLEQLPDSSDFKIEYAFEEIEVGVGEKPEEIEEEELMDEEGVVIGKLGVPLKHFWVVAAGLLIFTGTLFFILYASLTSEVARATSVAKATSQEMMSAVTPVWQATYPEAGFLDAH